VRDGDAELNRYVAADEDVVRDVVRRLTTCYEQAIDDLIDAGQEARYRDLLMAAHNFHKSVILDVAQREQLSGGEFRAYVRMWRRTFDEAMARAEP
jgi:hypothetical protein